MNDNNEKYPFCIFKNQDQYVILLTKDHSIQSWDNTVEAVRYFEDGYNRAHGTSLGHSTGAALHWMFTQPSIVEMSLDDLIPYLDPSHTIMQMGFDHVGKMNQEKAAELWERGIKPRLI